MSSETVLYMVIPCYNEQEVLPDSAKKLKNKISDLIARKKIGKNSKICFVNDGSRDRTWEMIQELCQKDPVYSGICLAHNEGHQNAVLAGLMTVQPYCDAAISIDADLQDDIDAIDAMVDKYGEGCNIVYGVRDNRESDTWFKRFTAEGFYRFMKNMGAEVIFNHADFRLMDKKALAAFGEYQEVNLFLRGIVPMIGLKHDCVYYKRKERLAGESKYPLKKMFAFAWQGITSLSSKPIKFIVNLGLGISVISGLVLLWSLFRHFTGQTIAGWTSLIISLWLLGGLMHHRRICGKDLSGSEAPSPVSGAGVYRRKSEKQRRSEKLSRKAGNCPALKRKTPVCKIKKTFCVGIARFTSCVTESLFRQKNGAGDGNRTHNISLEGWSFTTKLHPRFNVLPVFSYRITLRSQCFRTVNSPFLRQKHYN